MADSWSKNSLEDFFLGETAGGNYQYPIVAFVMEDVTSLNR